MKIVILSCSTNEPSNSDALAEAFMRGAKSVAGMEAEKIRLKDAKLEHFTLDHYRAGYPQGADFERIKGAVLEAAGIVIATPIWNFSVPAQLKNLIDRMGEFALDTATRSLGMLKGKPFYYLITAGGGMGSWMGLMKRTTNHLQVSLQYFAATNVGTYFEPKCTAGKGDFRLVVDKRPESLGKAEELGAGFARVAAEYAHTGRVSVSAASLWQKMFLLGQRMLKALRITP